MLTTGKTYKGISGRGGGEGGGGCLSTDYCR